ncbi:hypothetical protein HAX54_030253, partial [Datura stramonium]|nr:hypothetical protein [Datura stramonium]
SRNDSWYSGTGHGMPSYDKLQRIINGISDDTSTMVWIVPNTHGVKSRKLVKAAPYTMSHRTTRGIQGRVMMGVHGLEFIKVKKSGPQIMTSNHESWCQPMTHGVSCDDWQTIPKLFFLKPF